MKPQTENHKIHENEVHFSIYFLDKKNIIKIFGYCFLVFTLAITFYLPVEKNIINFVEKQISNFKTCPIQYSEIGLEYFLPKVILSNVSVPSKCLNNNGKDLDLDKVIARISVPSIWPFGIKSKVSIKAEGANINLFPRVSFNQYDFQIEDTFITGRFLTKLLDIPLRINGDISVQANAEMKGRKFLFPGLSLKSNNLAIPSQDIKGFVLPTLDFKKLEIAAIQTRKSINIKAIHLGNVESPINAQFKGEIIPNMKNIKASQIKLEGKIKFSETLLENFSLLKIPLMGKKKKDGYYFIKINGSLSNPRHQFIDPS